MRPRDGSSTGCSTRATALQLLLRCVLLMLVVLCGSTARSEAPTEENIARPVAAGRVVKFFDFEESEFNTSPVPLGWFRAQDDPPSRLRPGFPSWNKAEFSTRMARSGSTSVGVPTLGGSATLRLAGNALAVFPAADYLVTAAIRTEGLSAARASISARFLDSDLKPILASEVRSELVYSPDDWTSIALRVPGKWQTAAYIQLDLELLQPQQFSGSSGPAKHQVWNEDTKGFAYFDDVGVFQLPRLELIPTGGQPIIISPDALAFGAVVRDLTGEDLTATLTLRDIAGEIIASEVQHMGPGGGELDWSPAVSKFGWYEAQLAISSGSAIVGRASCAVVWLPPRTAATTSGRGIMPKRDVSFGVVTSSMSESQLAAIPDLLSRLRIFALTLPVVTTAQPMDINALKNVIQRLLVGGVQPTLWIQGISPQVANELRIEAQEPLLLTDHPEAVWLAMVQPLLDVFGQRIPRWQVGAVPSLPTWSEQDLGARLKKFRTVLERTCPGAKLSLPWSGDLTWPTGPGAPPAQTINITLPAHFPVTSIPALVQQWRVGLDSQTFAGAMPPELHVTILTDPDEAPEDQATDLIQRTAMLWRELEMSENAGEGSRPRLSILDPWQPAAGPGLAIVPGPMLGVWTNLAERLTGRRVVAVLENQPNLICIVLAGPPSAQPGVRSTGTIIAWAGNRAADATLRGYFTAPGNSLKLFDAFGNTSIILPQDSSGLYTINVGSRPVILEGVDTELTQFSAGFTISPSFVQAVATVHEHEIVLRNPWPMRITGEIHLPSQQQAGRQPWRFTPSAPITFSIAPGQTQRLPFAFSFGPTEEAGPRTLQASVKLTADQIYPIMKLAAPLTIGLEDLELNTSISLGPTVSGPDVFVVATVTNTGRFNRTLQVELVAPGEARQRLPVSNLGPGESAVRKFVVRGGASKLAGKRLRVTLVDNEGLERLNKFVVVP